MLSATFSLQPLQEALSTQQATGGDRYVTTCPFYVDFKLTNSSSSGLELAHQSSSSSSVSASRKPKSSASAKLSAKPVKTSPQLSSLKAKSPSNVTGSS